MLILTSFLTFFNAETQNAYILFWPCVPDWTPKAGHETNLTTDQAILATFSSNSFH